MQQPHPASEQGVEKHTIAFSIVGESTVVAHDCDGEETVETVVAKLAAAQNRPELSQLLVSFENVDEPATTGAAVRDLLHGDRSGRAHLHRCPRISVTVEYNGKSIAADLPPAATIHRVLQWSAGPHGFNILDDIHDLALQVIGTSKALEPNVHIGTLVPLGSCTLALELVAKDRPQG